MPPKKKVKTSKDAQVKGDEAEEIIKTYLREQYRPYSAADIVLNLHNKISKANAIKALDSLAEQGEIVSKSYGKLTFYVCKEEHSTHEKDQTESTEDKITLEVVNELRNQFHEVSKEVKNLSIELNKILSEPSNDELVKKIEQLKEENEKSDKRIKELSNNDKPTLNREELDKVKERTKIMSLHFKERKKIFDNFCKLLKDNLDDYKKVLDKSGVEEVVIENIDIKL